jgi:hypothetical protein
LYMLYFVYAISLRTSIKMSAPKSHTDTPQEQQNNDSDDVIVLTSSDEEDDTPECADTGTAENAAPREHFEDLFAKRLNIIRTAVCVSQLDIDTTESLDKLQLDALTEQFIEFVSNYKSDTGESDYTTAHISYSDMSAGYDPMRHLTNRERATQSAQTKSDVFVDTAEEGEDEEEEEENQVNEERDDDDADDEEDDEYDDDDDDDYDDDEEEEDVAVAHVKEEEVAHATTNNKVFRKGRRISKSSDDDVDDDKEETAEDFDTPNRVIDDDAEQSSKRPKLRQEQVGKAAADALNVLLKVLNRPGFGRIRDAYSDTALATFETEIQTCAYALDDLAIPSRETRVSADCAEEWLEDVIGGLPMVSEEDKAALAQIVQNLKDDGKFLGDAEFLALDHVIYTLRTAADEGESSTDRMCRIANLLRPDSQADLFKLMRVIHIAHHMRTRLIFTVFYHVSVMQFENASALLAQLRKVVTSITTYVADLEDNFLNDRLIFLGQLFMLLPETYVRPMEAFSF